MYILTQDGLRIVPFGEADTITLEEDRAFDYDKMKYSESETRFYLYLYYDDPDESRQLLGVFNTKERGAFAISEILYAIENCKNVVEITHDKDGEA